MSANVPAGTQRRGAQAAPSNSPGSSSAVLVSGMTCFPADTKCSGSENRLPCGSMSTRQSCVGAAASYFQTRCTLTSWGSLESEKALWPAYWREKNPPVAVTCRTSAEAPRDSSRRRSVRSPTSLLSGGRNGSPMHKRPSKRIQLSRPRKTAWRMVLSETTRVLRTTREAVRMSPCWNCMRTRTQVDVWIGADEPKPPHERGEVTRSQAAGTALRGFILMEVPRGINFTETLCRGENTSVAIGGSEAAMKG